MTKYIANIHFLKNDLCLNATCIKNEVTFVLFSFANTLSRRIAMLS